MLECFQGDRVFTITLSLKGYNPNTPRFQPIDMLFFIAAIAIIWAEFSANVCLEYIHFQVFAFVMH